MKRSIKKLNLNKKAISSLSEKVVGGARRTGKTSGPLTCTDPTARTMCYICPVREL